MKMGDETPQYHHQDQCTFWVVVRVGPYVQQHIHTAEITLLMEFSNELE